MSRLGLGVQRLDLVGEQPQTIVTRLQLATGRALRRGAETGVV
jgi:hypothetical protein